MKLWEALKEMDENPKKRFKSKYGFGEVTLEYCNGIKFIGVQKTKNGTFLSELRDWQEVKQPVTWQEAIEAWVNGKRIRCVINKAEFIFEKSHYREFQDQNDYGLAVEHITKGTWYIED